MIRITFYRPKIFTREFWRKWKQKRKQGFLDEEIAAEMAKSNQLGLADLIFDSLKDVLKRKGGNADNSL